MTNNIKYSGSTTILLLLIMEKILLKDTTNIDVETKDIMVSGLDMVNTSFLPLNINITNCDFLLSSAIVNKRNTEILGVVLVSTVYLDCFNGENGCFIWGCGIVNNIKYINDSKNLDHLTDFFIFYSPFLT